MASTGQSTLTGNFYYSGQVSFASVTLPAGCVTNANIQVNAGIDSTKVYHQPVGVGSCFALADPATTVSAVTKYLFTAKAAGTLTSFAALVNTVATGSDRIFTVDLKKASAGSNSFSSVLSGAISIDYTATANTLVAGTITSASYVAGDTFEVVTTVSGSASAAAIGSLAQLITSEAPQ